MLSKSGTGTMLASKIVILDVQTNLLGRGADRLIKVIEIKKSRLIHENFPFQQIKDPIINLKNFL